MGVGQRCIITGCSLGDIPGAMNGRDRWQDNHGILCYCCDLPANINRSDYSFVLEKLHPGTAGNDEALFDPNLP